jgi:hypothetical protein
MGRPAKLAPTVERELIRAYANNVPVDAIAERFGVSVWTVNVIRRKCGLSRYRPRAGQRQHPTLRQLEGLPPKEAPPRVKRYACPGCGTRAENPEGHPQCQDQQAA